jgi:hypothetical protein
MDMPQTAISGPVAQLEIAAHLASAGAADADAESIAWRLSALASELSAAGLSAVAVDAEQAAVDVLRAAGASPVVLDDHLVLLARRLHARAVHLVGAGRTAEAVVEGREALAAYRDAAAAGSDVDRIAVARERARLERLFAARGLTLVPR